MIRRCLVLSLLVLNGALAADSNQRHEPSLFLEYEREVTRTIDTTQDEANPFKRIVAPITARKVTTAPAVRIVAQPEPITTIPATVKPEIGNDALPYLVINKPVSPSSMASLSCPDAMVSNVVAKIDEKPKKSLFENIHTVKDRVMARAKELLGTPYGFGSKESYQTDCSGFTQQVFNQFGVSLPHSAAGQAEYGERVDANDLQVGDLVFYHTYKDEPSHVAIYAGDGQIIHASYKNRRVQYDAMDKGYYKQRFMYAKRIALNSRDTSNE